MKELEIIPIEYGKSVLSENMIFQGGAEDKFRPIVFMIYLIKTQDRFILADAGCETMPGFEMRDFIGSVKAQKINIKKDSRENKGICLVAKRAMQSEFQEKIIERCKTQIKNSKLNSIQK